MVAGARFFSGMATCCRGCVDAADMLDEDF
jgi:hypothetical protein